MLRITRQMAAGWRYSTAESESAARLAALGRTSVLVAGKRPYHWGLDDTFTFVRALVLSTPSQPTFAAVGALPSPTLGDEPLLIRGPIAN